MKTAWLPRLLVPLLLALGLARAGANDVRFSHTLSAEEKTATGVARLNSDQVAVLDALVRRDTATRGATPAPKTAAEAAPHAFSERLTADERRNTGIASLAAAEVPKLDATIDRYQSARLARTFLAPPEFLSPQRRVTPTEKKDERRIHGSFSLSYGWGKGGYSEKTGSMVVHIDDPNRNFSVSIGYSESHVKGGYIYRDPFYDPAYRGPDLRDPTPP